MKYIHNNKEFVSVEHGPLAIWEMPKPGIRYTMGIDTATGLSTDYTVMQVLTNQLPFRQVARFRAKCSVVDAAKYANELGLFYNTALAVVETNYPGNAVQDGLIQVYRYPRSYKAEEHMDEDPGISSKYGFQTTQASKWMLIREMQQALQSNDIQIFDPVTVEELGSYVYIEDKTKTGAAPGLNDDCVMALMLAYHGAMLFPQRKAISQEIQSKQSETVKALWGKIRKSILNQEESIGSIA